MVLRRPQNVTARFQVSAARRLLTCFEYRVARARARRVFRRLYRQVVN